VFHVVRVFFLFHARSFVIRRYPRLCVFAFEYFVFLGRVTNPSAKLPLLEDQFVLVWPLSYSLFGLGGPTRNIKFPLAEPIRSLRPVSLLPHHDKVETIGGDIFI